jgi:ribonuclease HI
MYTDGACSPNPGRGGYGVLLVENGVKRELSGGFLETTNNRMELFSVIAGLRALPPDASPVTVYSDSRYVVDMYSGGHAQRWRAHGWTRGPRREPALNPDLWGELLDLCRRHRVTMVWVRGHNEHPENARCDELAVQARQRSDLPPDPGYQKPDTVSVSEQLTLF